MLEVKVEKCAGIDVGKKFLAICVLIGLANRKPVAEVRRFGASVKELELFPFAQLVLSLNCVRCFSRDKGSDPLAT